jgi:hypothetical protein
MMTFQRMPAIFAVTGTGLGRPAGRLCLLAASLTLVFLPLVQLATASAAPGPKRPSADQVQPGSADSLLPATPRSVAPPPQTGPMTGPRTANERAIADIRQRIDLIDARIAAERAAENAKSADHDPALPGDTSLTGPGPAPALAVTTDDTLRHDTTVRIQTGSDVVASVPAGDRRRPATSPD